EAPEFARGAVEAWGERIAIGLDARGGRVAVRGWRETADRLATDLAADLEAWGVRRIVYTDVERDGTLTQPNWQTLESFVCSRRLGVIAAGGVATVPQLRRLQALGVEGAIVGSALYTGAIDLREALAALRAP